MQVDLGCDCKYSAWLTTAVKELAADAHPTICVKGTLFPSPILTRRRVDFLLISTPVAIAINCHDIFHMIRVISEREAHTARARVKL